MCIYKISTCRLGNCMEWIRSVIGQATQLTTFGFSCRTCNDDTQKLKVKFVPFIITGEMGWFAASCEQQA